jgi:hypothetical protein
MKFALALLLLLSGCAAIAADSRRSELHRELDPLKGRLTPERCAQQWGPPDKRDAIGESEYWTYVREYGARHHVIQNSYTGQVYGGRSTSRYDKIVLEFRDGFLFNWRADVQR